MHQLLHENPFLALHICSTPTTWTSTQQYQQTQNQIIIHNTYIVTTQYSNSCSVPFHLSSAVSETQPSPISNNIKFPCIWEPDKINYIRWEGKDKSKEIHRIKIFSQNQALCSTSISIITLHKRYCVPHICNHTTQLQTSHKSTIHLCVICYQNYATQRTNRFPWQSLTDIVTAMFRQNVSSGYRRILRKTWQQSGYGNSLLGWTRMTLLTTGVH